MRWAQNTQLCIYFLTFFQVLFLQWIYLIFIWTFIVLGSIWVSQIYKNTVKGSRGVPNMNYAGWMTLHITLIPLYSLLVDHNIAFFEPDRVKGLILAIWVCTQLAILQIQ